MENILLNMLYFEPEVLKLMKVKYYLCYYGCVVVNSSMLFYTSHINIYYSFNLYIESHIYDDENLITNQCNHKNRISWLNEITKDKFYWIHGLDRINL